LTLGSLLLIYLPIPNPDPPKAVIQKEIKPRRARRTQRKK